MNRHSAEELIFNILSVYLLACIFCWHLLLHLLYIDAWVENFKLTFCFHLFSGLLTWKQWLRTFYLPDIVTVTDQLRWLTSMSKGANKLKRRVDVPPVIRNPRSEMSLVILFPYCCFVLFSWSRCSDTTKCVWISLDSNLHSWVHTKLGNQE